MTALASATCFLAHASKSAGSNVCRGWGLASSIMRPTTILAAWTSIASLICWQGG